MHQPAIDEPALAAQCDAFFNSSDLLGCPRLLQSAQGSFIPSKRFNIMQVLVFLPVFAVSGNGKADLTISGGG
jgi:hypothetical protein